MLILTLFPTRHSVFGRVPKTVSCVVKKTKSPEKKKDDVYSLYHKKFELDISYFGSLGET